MAPTLTATQADLIGWQNDVIKKGQYESLGRVMYISVGDSADYTPPPNPDNYLKRYGRLMTFRRCMLPIALSNDNTQLLITAPLLVSRCPRCKAQQISAGPGTCICEQCLLAYSATPVADLPDVPDPLWVSPERTSDEIQGKVPVAPEKIHSPMLPQRLIDRCEQKDGRPALLSGSDFLVFQPVVRIAYQAETLGMLTAAAGMISCGPGAGGLQTALVIDRFTGEAHFIGGKFVLALKR